ncbi:hypothetical protein E4V01_18855 [Methylorubrum sp. Q1]|uniref:hypothetical protein n=1 Tax=Methylorubrum sp. Q1 TaxID=2562453 RepID=UPI0011028541|nr:hypothetical protein [Methylorubrum sp. Q1]TFZ56389.1 hypothetical protein E4V01_18855 [Methylorubrum sp. Q1]
MLIVSVAHNPRVSHIVRALALVVCAVILVTDGPAGPAIRFEDAGTRQHCAQIVHGVFAPDRDTKFGNVIINLCRGDWPNTVRNKHACGSDGL